jgi:NADH:ubiquinone oxidoreductase subunit F (NADH-binding)/NADH:ubiquinone oxidoreductase subunit E
MGLISRLNELQEAHGYLSEERLRELAEAENVPLYRLQGLVTFYPHFRTTPAPRVELTVCRDMACWLNDGEGRATALRRELADVQGVEIHDVSCLGRCDAAPAAACNGVTVTLAPDAAVRRWVDQPDSLSNPFAPPRRWRCDPYASVDDRYGILRALLRRDRGAAEAVLAALKESGLRGMGGAGFPTGTKWELVRKEARTPKYVICNADESEPGTFKDRVILADLAHLLIEGMILAGLVVGAEKGILYIRHEYGPERAAFAAALADARTQGLLGTNILGRGFDFDVEIFVSPGGYILGEETALLEALEDKRGEPRNKPPFPGTHGLHGQPTLINNVETLAMVPGILLRGPAWWKGQGKKGFTGLKFVALSGHVEKAGVYEVPGGTTVRELIALGGGVKDGRRLLAFAPGGASSNFLPASQVDVPLDFAALAKAGSMLGSGAVVVVAEGTDMLALATNVVRFFRNESCGKCVPCRVGSQKAVELLERVQEGTADRRELAVLPELGETLMLTSICGLGQVALNPVLSVMLHWPEESRNAPSSTKRPL